MLVGPTAMEKRLDCAVTQESQWVIIARRVELYTILLRSLANKISGRLALVAGGPSCLPQLTAKKKSAFR
jgi:hypothetical protein